MTTLLFPQMILHCRQEPQVQIDPKQLRSNFSNIRNNGSKDCHAFFQSIFLYKMNWDNSFVNGYAATTTMVVPQQPRILPKQDQQQPSTVSVCLSMQHSTGAGNSHSELLLQ